MNFVIIHLEFFFMKKPILTLLFLAMLTLGYGQKQVVLEIKHMLGSEAFELGKVSENNLNQTFKVERLQYYLSYISIIHDNGIKTTLDDLYVLVNAEEKTTIDLGSFDFQSIEAVELHVGVDEAKNHLDPSKYNPSHPLAPKVPSMHWGWTGGYRFVALEGKSGPDLNLEMQIHSLGDANYLTTTILNPVVQDNGTINIVLEADYSRLLESIVIENGLFTHGFDNESITIMENFRDFTFLNAVPVSIKQTNQVDLSLAPNPCIKGESILINHTNHLSHIVIYDFQGKLVDSQMVPDNHKISTKNLNPGTYTIQFWDKSKFIGIKKIVIL